MDKREPAARIRRIVVGIDASPSSLAALEAAVRLASELEAELEGLFIEDENLLRFAGLPFTRVVDSLLGSPRPFESADIEHDLRSRAERARKALAQAAGTRVTWTFRVARGRVEDELLAAARRADLLSLGFFGARPAGAARAGSLARRAAREATASVLLLRQHKAAGTPVAVCYEEGPEGERALLSAAALARAQDSGFTVMTFAADDEEAREIERSVAELLSDWKLEPRFLHLGTAGGRDLRAAARAACGGILVVGADSALDHGEVLRSLVENCACSLLLTR
ncbi:MAG: universal stress protein [Alphaproteobacteria bacterium]